MDRDSDDDRGEGPSGGASAGFGPAEEPQVDLGLNFDEHLDTDGMDRRIWMVKVPKFLLERWQNVREDNVELGRLRVYNKKDANGQERIAVLLPPNDEADENPIPTEYFMTIQNKATKNTLIYAEREDVTIGEAGWEPGRGRIRPGDEGETEARPAKKRKPTLTGVVHHECNLTPRVDSESYRAIVRKRQKKAAEPKRKLQMVDNLDMETTRLGITGMRTVKFDTFVKGKETAKKGEGNKLVRIPRNELLDMLFTAFEQYDYWSMKNLRAHTQQPESYLKEVLADLAQLNKRGPYAGMWSLQEAYKKRVKQAPAALDGSAKKEEGGDDPAVKDEPMDGADDDDDDDDDDIDMDMIA